MNKIVNLRSAKYLVRRYEKFLKMEIPENITFVDYLSDVTGFRVDCMLCKEVIKKIGSCYCRACIWTLEEKQIGVGKGCFNKNYYRLTTERTQEEGKKLLTERIAMLKELIKKAESKKWKK